MNAAIPVENGSLHQLLVLAIVGLFLLAVGAILTLVAHHTISRSQRRRREECLAAARRVLARSLNAPEALAATVAEAVRVAGRDATATVLREYRLRIDGPYGRALSFQLDAMGEVARLGRRSRAMRGSVRCEAARLLGECGGHEVTEPLVHLLKDADREVRRTARTGLLSTGHRPAVRAAIESYLAEGRSDYRAAFYAQLATVAAGELRLLLQSGRLAGLEEKLAVEALADVHDDDQVPAATALAAGYLDSASAELRASAVRVVGRHRCHALRGRVVEALADAEWFVRAVAARALETLGPDDATDHALAGALADQWSWVRNNAARSLAHRGEAGRAVLREALGRDAAVRAAALAALAMVPAGVAWRREAARPT